MDRLTTHQLYFESMRRFFEERDDLLQHVLEDGALLASLLPTLAENETPAGIYEILVTKANWASKAFVLAVVQAIFSIFKAVVVGKKSRNNGETNFQFRQIMARTNFESRSAREFTLSNEVLRTLKTSLELAWQAYVRRIDDFEKGYLEKYFSKQVLSTGQQRIARLPTSYLRLRIQTEFEGKALVWPVFRPGSVVTMDFLKSVDFADDPDELYQPPLELITGTGLQNDDGLTKVEMPDELGFLNI